MVDVHIIVLAEQSSPILAVCNGGNERYQVLLPSPSQQPGPYATANWTKLLLFCLHSSGVCVFV